MADVPMLDAQPHIDFGSIDAHFEGLLDPRLIDHCNTEFNNKKYKYNFMDSNMESKNLCKILKYMMIYILTKNNFDYRSELNYTILLREYNTYCINYINQVYSRLEYYKLNINKTIQPIQFDKHPQLDINNDYNNINIICYMKSFNYYLNYIKYIFGEKYLSPIIDKKININLFCDHNTFNYWRENLISIRFVERNIQYEPVYNKIKKLFNYLPLLLLFFNEEDIKDNIFNDEVDFFLKNININIIVSDDKLMSGIGCKRAIINNVMTKKMINKAMTIDDNISGIIEHNYTNSLEDSLVFFVEEQDPSNIPKCGKRNCSEKVINPILIIILYNLIKNDNFSSSIFNKYVILKIDKIKNKDKHLNDTMATLLKSSNPPENLFKLINDIYNIYNIIMNEPSDQSSYKDICDKILNCNKELISRTYTKYDIKIGEIYRMITDLINILKLNTNIYDLYEELKSKIHDKLLMIGIDKGGGMGDEAFKNLGTINKTNKIYKLSLTNHRLNNKVNYNPFCVVFMEDLLYNIMLTSYFPRYGTGIYNKYHLRFIHKKLDDNDDIFPIKINSSENTGNKTYMWLMNLLVLMLYSNVESENINAIYSKYIFETNTNNSEQILQLNYLGDNILKLRTTDTNYGKYQIYHTMLFVLYLFCCTDIFNKIGSNINYIKTYNTIFNIEGKEGSDKPFAINSNISYELIKYNIYNHSYLIKLNNNVTPSNRRSTLSNILNIGTIIPILNSYNNDIYDNYIYHILLNEFIYLNTNEYNNNYLISYNYIHDIIIKFLNSDRSTCDFTNIKMDIGKYKDTEIFFITNDNYYKFDKQLKITNIDGTDIIDKIDFIKSLYEELRKRYPDRYNSFSNESIDNLYKNIIIKHPTELGKRGNSEEEPLIKPRSSKKPRTEKEKYIKYKNKYLALKKEMQALNLI